jgi:drug/metabolite transporter (DMT)-like permease
MTSLAITLVLASAFFHATWNLAAKRATHNGTAFIWLFGIFEVVLYIPLFVWTLIRDQPAIGLTELFFIVGSSSLHFIYFILLSKGYRVGDLSVVYPLARSIGPLLATVAAIILFHERPSLLAMSGTAMICGGVFWLTGDPRKLRENNALAGVAMAALTGLSIAAYTLWDSYAVSVIAIPPIIYQWGISASRLVLVTPYALRHRAEVRLAWRHDKGKAVIIGTLSSLSYLLMLMAFTLSPVSYVAPLRVVSTLMGVLLGTRLLNEGQSLRRLGAALTMVVGVFALSLG